MRGGDRSGSNPSRADSLCWPSSPRRPRGTVAFTLLLSGRRQLKRKLLDIENELRGSLKAFGIKIGRVSRSNFETRALEPVDAAEHWHAGRPASCVD